MEKRLVKISTSDTAPRTKKRRGLVLVQLFIVIGFLAMLWFSFGQNVLAPVKQGGVPENLGDLKLASQIKGTEALAQINKLHGTEILLVDAFIARYAPVYASSAHVTIWVGKAKDSDTAAELLRRMTTGIANGNPSFSNLKKLSLAGQEVFQVEGPGGQHFFYRSQKTEEAVVWLTVETHDAMSILEQTLRTF